MIAPARVPLWGALLAAVFPVAQADRKPITLPQTAKRIEIVVFQDAWMLDGRTGERYRADLFKASDTLWYTFEMPKDGVIYLQNLSTEQNYSTLELFDSKGYDPDPGSWLENRPRRVFNGRIPKGQYFLRISCPKGCKEPVVTELARFEQ